MRNGLGSRGQPRSNEYGLAIGVQFIADPAAEPDASCMEELTSPDFE